MIKYIDNKGKLVGREVNGILLDGQGKNLGRFIKSSNMTVDGKGHNTGRGDVTTKQLGK